MAALLISTATISTPVLAGEATGSLSPDGLSQTIIGTGLTEEALKAAVGSNIDLNSQVRRLAGHLAEAKHDAEGDVT